MEPAKCSCLRDERNKELRELDRKSDFIMNRAMHLNLDDGTSILVRPIACDDKILIENAFKQLSSRSRYLRFLSARKRLSKNDLKYLTELDYLNHYAWVAETSYKAKPRIISVVRFIRIPASREVAEAAVTVIDQYQGRGLGSILFWILSETALNLGIRYFAVYVHPGNNRVIDWCDRLCAKKLYKSGVVEMKIPIPLPYKPKQAAIILRILHAETVEAVSA